MEIKQIKGAPNYIYNNLDYQNIFLRKFSNIAKFIYRITMLNNYFNYGAMNGHPTQGYLSNLMFACTKNFNFFLSKLWPKEHKSYLIFVLYCRLLDHEWIDEHGWFWHERMLSFHFSLSLLWLDLPPPLFIFWIYWFFLFIEIW